MKQINCDRLRGWGQINKDTCSSTGRARRVIKKAVGFCQRTLLLTPMLNWLPREQWGLCSVQQALWSVCGWVLPSLFTTLNFVVPSTFLFFPFSYWLSPPVVTLHSALCFTPPFCTFGTVQLLPYFFLAPLTGLRARLQVEIFDRIY